MSLSSSSVSSFNTEGICSNVTSTISYDSDENEDDLFVLEVDHHPDHSKHALFRLAEWSSDEKRVLMKYIRVYGNRFDARQIVNCLPNKNVIQVANYLKALQHVSELSKRGCIRSGEGVGFIDESSSEEIECRNSIEENSSMEFDCENDECSDSDDEDEDVIIERPFQTFDDVSLEDKRKMIDFKKISAIAQRYGLTVDDTCHEYLYNCLRSFIQLIVREIPLYMKPARFSSSATVLLQHVQHIMRNLGIVITTDDDDDDDDGDSDVDDGDNDVDDGDNDVDDGDNGDDDDDGDNGDDDDDDGDNGDDGDNDVDDGDNDDDGDGVDDDGDNDGQLSCINDESYDHDDKITDKQSSCSSTDDDNMMM